MNLQKIYLGLILLCGIHYPSQLLAETNRFFDPTDGFQRAKDLPEDYRAVAGKIKLEIKDAFEGSTVHSDAEAWLYDIGNKLHIESRPNTIRRRLLFAIGDTITKSLLIETEKKLRSEEFLADAIIEVGPSEMQSGDSNSTPNGVEVIVTTYDQWTTVAGASIGREGGKWKYWVGPVESNLLGTGQRIGFFLGHDQLRDTKWIDYNNTTLFPQKLHLAAHIANLSDGYSVLFDLSKPLEARTDRYSFSASISAVEYSEYVYFDANRYDRLPPINVDSLAGAGAALQRFNRVATHDFNLSVTRSFGYHTKFNIIPTFDRHDRYNNGQIYFYPGSRYTISNLDASAKIPTTRLDYLLGLKLSLYQYDYKTVMNFNNLKWSESIQTGWRLTTKFAKNQSWMGARNDDFYLSHQAVYNDIYFGNIFVNTGASMLYFLSPQGDFDDGYNSGSFEMQWKPIWFTSTYVSAGWANYFASEKAQQVLLGEDNGLNGYPNFYYAGQARLLLEAEQRFFPNLEMGTVVPAFAIFGNAGNTYDNYSSFDPNKLHYSLGLGLRLGLSKSVQKLVNHLNLSWPIGEKHLSGPVFSILAKKGL